MSDIVKRLEEFLKQPNLRETLQQELRESSWETICQDPVTVQEKQKRKREVTEDRTAEVKINKTVTQMVDESNSQPTRKRKGDDSLEILEVQDKNSVSQSKKQCNQTNNYPRELVNHSQPVSNVLDKTLKSALSEETQIVQTDKLRILQLNAHGALTNQKVAYLKELIKLHHPDVILVNEFGHTKEIPVFPIIETYRIMTFDLKTTFSGVAVYVQAAFVNLAELVQVVHLMEYTQIAGIQIQGLKIFTVYRSPRNHDPEVKDLETERFCDWISNLENDNVLIIGDINLSVCWETYTSKREDHERIAQSLLEKNFVQYQTEPTFHRSQNILDVTLCNSFSTVLRCTVDKFSIIPGIDHFPTITDLHLETEIEEEKEVLLRKKRDQEKYAEIVRKGMDFLMEKHIPDVDRIVPSVQLMEDMENDLKNLLLYAEEQAVPKVKIKQRTFKTKSIHSFSTKTSKLFKYKYKLLAKGSKSKADKLQKEIDLSLAEDRKKWSQKFVNNLAKNPNLIWSVVKGGTFKTSSTGGLRKADDTLTFNPHEKTKLLSERYGSVLTPKTLPTCNVDDLTTCQTTPGLCDVVFTNIKVIKILKSCNPSMAMDSRGLYVPLYRDVKEELALYLAILFNMTTQTAYLVAAWLIAMVLPIPKSGDLTIPKNWRGIVLEQSLLRIYEKGLNYDIVEYLESINFFHPSQSGFRWDKSCIHNLVSFWTYLVGLMQDYHAVDVIYADTSAAFDRLSHGPLLDKLFHRCGIYGNLWKTLQAWCTNRTQFVRWNGVDSEEIEVTSSCMQGSCLGTTLWNIYFNDVLIKIEEWIEELDVDGASFYAYADDIKIIYPAIPENYPKVNELLRRLQDEMDSLHLKFNPDKFKVLTLGEVNPKLDVKMRGEEGQEITIQRSEVERDLGILVDSNGKFTSQIKRALAVSRSTVKILRRIFCKMSFEDKKKLYHAYVFSRMSYGSEIWITRDRKILDDFNKIMVDLFEFSEVQHGHWPPYTPEQLFMEKDLLMMHDIFHHKSPVMKEEIFLDLPPDPPGSQTRARSQNEIRRTGWNNWSDTLLVNRNRDIWNKIPRLIRESSNRFDFQEYVRSSILEKMPCNSIRDDLLSGALRQKALRRLKHQENARRANDPELQELSNFMTDEDFRDDFLKPDLCLKQMKKRNYAKLKDLAKIAPWMLLCKCDRPTCTKERLDFEEKNDCKIRDLGKVNIVDDKVITKNKHLMTSTKKLADVLEQCSSDDEAENYY